MRFVVTLILIVAALAIMGWLADGPVPGERVPEGAARFAASQEYERALELYGDEAVAAQMAERAGQDVLEQWGGGIEVSRPTFIQ